MAGAATAATRISEVLHMHPAFRPDVTFNRREVTPLIQAAQADPPTWALLLEGADFSAFSAAQRRRLLQVCEELIDTLSADLPQIKVKALITDIERLRYRLRFDKREVTSLIEAAQAHPRSLALLLKDADFSACSAAQRKRLFAACEELIDTLSADLPQIKVKALITDIERLRNRLRATA
jgi:molybdopterin synthase catalytic subunit